MRHMLLAFLLFACAPIPEPEPVPPAPAPTVTVAPIPRLPCVQACDRLADLRCPGWEGSPDGTPCSEVCEDTESSGVARFCPWHVASIRTCEELEAAFSACE